MELRGVIQNNATGIPAVRVRRSSADPSTRGYVIFTCSYTPNSAGIGCLYRLCDELNRRGYPSFMTGGKETASHLNAPLLDIEAAEQMCAQGYAAIYPETIAGNPLKANSVIRWVLNRPGLLGGDEVYADSEHVFSYSNVFLPYIRNRVAGKLYMPTIDESLFYCEDEDLSKRSLECYYVGKSQWKDGVVDLARTFEITRETPDKKELGKIFRASRVLYCFDNSTILVYEALLCGCPVVIIPDGTQTKQDYEQLELGLDGIAWGHEEFNGAPVNVVGLRERYDLVKREFDWQLQQMIEISHPKNIGDHNGLSAARWTPREAGEWYRAPLHACRTGAKGVIHCGRTIERTVRRWRKRRAQRLKEIALVWGRSKSDDGSFFCTDGDLSKRSLECFYVGKSRWRDGVFERTKVFEIAPTIPAPQLGKLFRAARVFYSFDASTPLVQSALACGCPVVLIDKRGGTESLAPTKQLFESRS